MKKILFAILLAVSAILIVIPVYAQTAETYRYNYVGPWVLYSDEFGKYWGGPEGTLGSIDLRSLPEMGTIEGKPGLGYFVTDKPLPDPYILLSAGDKTVCLDNAVLAARINTLESTWNIKLDAITPRGMIWEMFCEDADPSGLTRWKPLQPGVDGILRLNLGGYSPVEFKKDHYTGREYAEKMASWRNTVGNN